MAKEFTDLLAEIQACRLCEADLPLGPRPVIRASETSRILIIGQAPGTRVHESGVPWNDASGERLRDWLQVDSETFYDAGRIAIMPMGFCYPGRNPKGGDNPPRPECVGAWHQQVLDRLNHIELTILVGQYAQNYYLKERKRKTMTETVRAWRDYGPDMIPTPHPSWRTTFWLKKNPWFESDILPVLRGRVRALLEVT